MLAKTPVVDTGLTGDRPTISMPMIQDVENVMGAIETGFQTNGA